MPGVVGGGADVDLDHPHLRVLEVRVQPLQIHEDPVGPVAKGAGLDAVFSNVVFM